MRPNRPTGFDRTRSILRLLLLGALVTTGACALPFGGPAPGEAAPAEPEAEAFQEPEPQPESTAGGRFRLALSAVERKDFSLAHRRLRELAGSCSSGVWGREALLVLASLELNPEYAGGSTQIGAHFAARYLQDPGAPASSVLLAETLYLLAVDLGAEPVADPMTPSDGQLSGVAQRFEECEDGKTVVPPPGRQLPHNPAPETTRRALERAEAQRDSLAVQVEELGRRASELQSELDRIRRLLLPDTVPPPGR